MTTTFKVTKSFGTETEIEKLTEQAIGIALATGSVGASYQEVTWDRDTNQEKITASVTVERN
jgi:hypothetical protein